MDDIYYLRKALKLAEKGKGKTSPNPIVGAILVKEGRIIGKGFHQKAGLPHSEIEAISKATEPVEGSTLYVNLEPCIHYGRTPPCVDAIIKAGIKRVVSCMPDPNPIVNGRSFAKLKKNGIEVKVGLLREEAEKLNETFIYYIKHKRPFVLIKVGLSLNGKLSPSIGKGEQITGAEAKKYVHQLRKEYDAIMVGVNTIMVDNPLLTSRPSNGNGTPLIRVVLDSRLRTPPDARIFEAKDGGGTIIFTCPNSPRVAHKELERVGAEIIQVGDKSGKIELKEVLELLGSREITSLIVEGGSKVIASALREGIAQKILLIYAPKIFASKDSIPLINPQMLDEGGNIFQLYYLRSFPLGDDIAIEAYLEPNRERIEE